MRSHKIKGRFTRRAAALLALPSVLLAFQSAAEAGTFTWTGGGADSNWSTGGAGGNWNGGAAPTGANTDDLHFSGNIGLSPVVDNAQNPWIVDSITFDASASGSFTISGNQVEFNGASSAIIQNSALTQTINDAILFNVATTLGGTGIGQVNLGGALTGSGAITVSGNNTFNISNSHTLGGVTITSGTLQVTAASGSMGNLTLAGGAFGFIGSAGANTTEAISQLALSSGSSTFTVSSAGSKTASVTAASFLRTGNAMALINGTNFGKSAAPYGRLTLTSTAGLTFWGTATSSGGAGTTKNLRIIPYLIGDTGIGTGNTFVTYDTTIGFRPLDTTNEFTTTITGTDSNVRFTAGATVSGSSTVNSLLMAGGNVSISNFRTLTISSGALLVTATSNISGSGTINFAREAVISVSPGVTATITGVSGTGTNGITKGGGGVLVLDSSNSITGTTTIDAGTLQIASTDTISTGDNLVIAGSGTFDFGASTAQTVAALSGLGTIGSSSTTRTSTLTTSFNGTSTFSGVIKDNITTGSSVGSGNHIILTKSGTGTLVLTGANSYSGATNVTAGTLNIQNATALGTTAAGTIVSTSATLQIQGGINVGAEPLSIRGTGAASQTGALVNVSGTNSFGGLLTLSGATTISSDSGSLDLSNTGNLVGGNFALTFAGAGNGTIESNLGTTVSGVTKSGAGVWGLGGSNTYTGTTTVSTGTLAAGSTSGFAPGSAFTIAGTLNLNGFNNTIGSLAGAGTVNNINASTTAATLTTGAAGGTTFSGQIQDGVGGGALTLNKAGSGTFILTGNSNTYSGGTNVNVGTLQVTNTSGSATGSGAVTVSSGATLAGSTVASQGFITGQVNVNGGGILSVSSATFGTTLTLGGLALNADSFSTGSTLLVALGSPSATPLINVTGTNGLVLNGTGKTTISIASGGSGGLYNLINFTGTDPTLANFNSNITGSGPFTYTLSDTGSQIDLTVAGAALTWTGRSGGTGTSTGTWDTGTTTNWANGAAASYFAASCPVTFNDTNALGTLGSTTVSIVSAGVTPGSVTFNNSTVAYTVSNASGSIGIAGATGLTKSGSASLTLSGVNTYTGGTTINGGVVSVASLTVEGTGATGSTASSIGQSNNSAANLVLNGGTLKYTGASTNTDRLFTLGSSGGTLDASGTGAINFTGTGSVAFSTVDQPESLTLTGTNTGANTLAPVIGNNGAGATSVFKSGAGTWALSGNSNTYSGGTNINVGTLQVTNTNGSATGTGTVTVSSGATLAGSTAASQGFITGQVNVNGGGILSVSSTVSGTTLTLGTVSTGGLTLNADSSATGSTLLVTLGSPSATPLINVIGSNGFVVNGSGKTTVSIASGTTPGIGTYNLIGFTGTDPTLANFNTISSTNPFTYTLSDTGTQIDLTVAAVALTWTGKTGGTGGNASTWDTTTANTNWANGSVASYYANTSGVTFNDTNAVNSGTPNATVTIVAAGVTPASVTFNNSTVNYTVSNASGSIGIAGPTGLTKSGSAGLTLSSVNTYTGVTTINGGVVSVASLTVEGTGATGSTASGIGQSNNSASNLVLNGGTLQYSGNTTATTDRLFTLGNSGGTLDASGTTTHPVSFTNTGSVAFSNTGQPESLTLTGANISANTLAVQIVDNGAGATSVSKTGLGTWVLSGANTYSGATSVSNGTLQVTNTNGSATGTGTVTVSSGATLAGSTAASQGFITGQVNVNGGGILSVSSTVSGTTLTLGTVSTGGLTLNADSSATGSTLLVTLGSPSATPLINVIGSNGLVVNGSGKTTVSIASGGSAGVYDLISFTGTDPGLSNFNSNIPSTGPFSYALSDTGSQIDMTVTAAPLTWTGKNGGTTTNNSWDTTTTSTNWANGSTASYYANGIAVTFNDTNAVNSGTPNATVKIVAAGVTPASVTFNNSTVNYTVSNASGSIGIAGPTGLTKSGSGTVILSSANTYTGPTGVSGGNLFVNGSLAAGSAVTISGTGTLGGTGNGTTSGLVNGTVAINSGGTITAGTNVNTVGKLTTGALTFNGGGSYDWNILNATGTAGTDWNQIHPSSLNISSLTSGSTFEIDMNSLSASGTTGALSTFDANIAQTWSILTSTAVISGFASNLFALNSTNFTNSLTGGSLSLGLGNSNKDLVITFTPMAGTGEWSGTSGTWSTASNWVGGTAANVAGGAGATADFSHVDVSGGDYTVTLSAPVTIGNLRFADTSGTGLHHWILTGSTLTLSGSSTPTIQLLNTAPGVATTINSLLAGTQGFNFTGAAGTASGSGLLLINGSNTGLSGQITVSGGTLTVGNVNALGTGGLTVNAGTVELLAASTISVANLQGTGGTIEITSAAATLSAGSDGASTSYSGLLTQSGTGSPLLSFTKVGSGALALGGSNSYKGVTTISGGTLSISSLVTEGAAGGTNSGIGASGNAAANLVLNGGTLKYTGATTSTDRNFTLSTNGGGFDASGTGPLTVTGSMTASGTSGNQTFTLTGSNLAVNTLGGTINNGTSTNVTILSKTGAGTWAITGANAFTGGVTIAAGTLQANTAAANGTTPTAQSLGKGTGLITLGSSSLLTGSAKLQYTGTSAGTWDRSITVAVGDSATISNTSGKLLTLTGGTITKIGGASPTILTMTGGQFLVGDNITGTNGTAFNSDYAVNGAATVTLSNAGNDYSGPTVVSGNSTLISGTAANALPASTTLTLGVVGDSAPNTNTFDLNGNAQTVTGLYNAGPATNRVINSNATTSGSGNGPNASMGALTVNIVSGINTVGSQLGVGTISNFSLTKSGGGTMVLSQSGGNSYTGGTTISGGTLLANNTTGSATGGGAVGVFNGATLAGTGNISALVTVSGGPLSSTTASGGNIGAGDAGVSATGNLNLNGGLSLAPATGSTSTYTWGFTTPATYDTLTVNTLSIGTGSTVDVVPVLVGTASGFTGQGQFQIIHGSAAQDTTNLATQFYLDSSALTAFTSAIGAPGGSVTFSGDTTGDVFMNYSPAPEPTSMALFGLGAGSLLLRRRRSQKTAV